jgi:hypothetical protein
MKNRGEQSIRKEVKRERERDLYQLKSGTLHSLGIFSGRKKRRLFGEKRPGRGPTVQVQPIKG